ncbi:hypothetical protein GCM10027031_20170 [Corynebacterium atrinae]
MWVESDHDGGDTAFLSQLGSPLDELLMPAVHAIKNANGDDRRLKGRRDIAYSVPNNHRFRLRHTLPV